MRNLIKVLLTSIFIILSFSTFVYAENTVVSMGNISGKLGDTIDIPINISGNTGICSFGMSFEYDKNYLQPVGTKKGLWDSEMVFNESYKGSENTAFATGAGMSNKTGDGVLFYISFNIKKEIDGNCIPIKLTVNQLKHVEGTKLSDVLYTINQGTVTPTPSEKMKIGFDSKYFLLSDIIKVPIEIKNNDGISTFGLCINYDSGFLTPVSVEKGIWDSEIIENLNYGKDKIFITGASAENKTGDGAFAYINFKVNKNAGLSTKLSLDVKQIKKKVQIDGKITTANVDYTALSGNIKFYKNSDKAKYDIDKDGNITANDASLILQYVLDKSKNNSGIGFKENNKIFGDVDNNGIITAADAALVLYVYLTD